LNVDEHILRREQWLPRPIEDVFAFFSEARNLEAMTPPWLGFRIVSPGTIVLRLGTRIHYRIRLHRLPLRWVTEIQTWGPPHEFVDVQLRGPYRFWHHTHRFERVDGGTLVRDAVRYVLPFGPLGRLAHAWIVKPDLEAIFDYRALRMTELLGLRSTHE
jgi:ligand-binding SRPBCC domain-containing protein